MGVITGNSRSPRRKLCIADLCQAIANGQIAPVVEGSCYKISDQDVRTVSATSEYSAMDILPLVPIETDASWEAVHR